MSAGPPYQDRREAGEVLGRRVREQWGRMDDAVVLALPRGGVPVGFEVAQALDAELDVCVVRKLGAPGFEEFAIGAIAAGGFQVLNERAIAEMNVSERDLAGVLAHESAELRRREGLYRGSALPTPIAGRTAILVDDGLATGFSLRAAIAALGAMGPRRRIVAVPVGAPDSCAELAREVDALVCPLQPPSFRSVGQWYRDFSATSDEEVRECLERSRVAP